MTYALNLSDENRILSAWDILPDGNYDGMPIVDTLPSGTMLDYLYVNGGYVYDPIPKPSAFPAAPRNITEGEYITVNGVMYKAITNIPNGEPIITGQNAVETTIEQQLYELAKGE
jgi:hypothetical protein